MKNFLPLLVPETIFLNEILYEFLKWNFSSNLKNWILSWFSGHPISEELNDSINCKVAKLELENEALKHEVTELNQKLCDSQMEVARLKVILILITVYQQKRHLCNVVSCTSLRKG